MIGTKILNYEIKSLLGEGGMGDVYLAEDAATNRKVAIKMIHAHLARNEHIRQRFKKEIETMARLQHVNIVSLYHHVIEDDRLSIIMEYVDGQPLDQYMQNINGPVEEDLAIELIKQVTAACEHAHAKGVVHRDIKPGNIIVDKNGVVKILDFGIAKIIGDESHKLTKTGLHIGTVYYMAPEQVQGHEVSPQTDIYSIGVTLFQLVTKVNPYKEFTSEFQIFNKIVKEPLPDVRQFNPELSNYLNKVIQKATKKNPAERFKNCGDFKKVLDEAEDYRKRHGGANVGSQGTRAPQGRPQPKPVHRSSKIDSTPFVLGIVGSSIAGFLALLGLIWCVPAVLGLLLGAVTLFFAKKWITKLRTDKEYDPHSSAIHFTNVTSFVTIGLAFIGLILCLVRTVNVDSDGDGFYDSDDLCPYEYGTADGCSDWDSDGVPDMEDNCSEVPGEEKFGGCPDSDGDGVQDSEDLCPQVSGDPNHSGCPDSDGDGIYDNEDNCPKDYGESINNGCPYEDSDGDGLTDDEDDCPDSYGPLSNDGCPYGDSDGDGLSDDEDDCPYEYGSRSNDGCPWPDYDNDGVPDKDDDCKYTKGPSWNDGCPYNYNDNTSSGSGSSSTNSSNKKVRFKNNSSVATISVAVCYWNGSTWVTKGWYNVKKGNYVNYDLPRNYSYSKIYYCAKGGGYTWSGGGITKCVSSNAFTYYDNVSNSCPKTEKFIEKKLSGSTTYVTFGD